MGVPYTFKPPGFSLLLSPVLAWRGLDFFALNLWVSLFGVGGIVLLFLHLEPRIGPILAFAAAVAIWVNPLFQQLCNEVMSDVPGLALALLALRAIDWSRDSRSLVRGFVAALAITAAVYIRTIHLVLLPAYFLDRLCYLGFGTTPRRHLVRLVIVRIGAPLALVGLLYAPWAARATPEAPPRGQIRVNSYVSALTRLHSEDSGSPSIQLADLVARSKTNLAYYSPLLATDLSSTEPSTVTTPVTALIVMGWLFILIRRRQAPEWLAGATLFILLFWNQFQERLLVLPFVLFMGAALEALRDGASRFLPIKSVDGLLLAGIVWVATTHFQFDFMPPDSRTKYEDLLQVAHHVRETIPATEKLGGEPGLAYAVLLDRPVYNLRPETKIRRRGLAGALEAIEREGLSTVIIDSEGPTAPVIHYARDVGWDVRTFGYYAVIRSGS